MPERFEQMRDALHADAGQLQWVDASQVRDRGAARTRRTVIVAGLAALLMVGGGVAAGASLVDRGSTPPAPPASASPVQDDLPTASESPDESPSTAPSKNPSEPTVEVPDSALLQPEDFGPGARVGSKNGAGGDWTLDWLFYAVCDAGRWTGTEGIANNVGTIEGASGPGAVQTVDRYRGGQGRTYLTDVIATTDRCRSMTRPGEGTITLTQVDHDFAGDASILVMVDYGEPGVGIRWHVFVRQGELVTEIGSNGSEEQARALGAKAAARMCNATPTC
ncbi:MAG: hypothetical protein ACRDT4_10035 [Micromonosporaceae bacterium]